MAPLTRMRSSDPGSAPGVLTAQYYAQRASRGGLIIAEATQISWQGKGYPRTPGIQSDQQEDGRKTVVDALHENGGRIILHLWHGGAISHASQHPVGAVPVSAAAVRGAGEALPAAMKKLP